MKLFDFLHRDWVVALLKRGAIAVLVVMFLPPSVAVAQPAQGLGDQEVFRADLSLTADLVPQQKPERRMVVTVTGYSSTMDQTDDTPCITANMYNVCASQEEDTVAANFLPFGAKIQIPSVFGSQVFVVRDRMHSRFNDRVDIWFTSRNRALNFGKKQLEIIVL